MTTRQKPLKKPKKLKASPKKSFLEHLQELKNRFALWLLAFVVMSLVGYLLKDAILTILLSPLNQPLYYSSPAGGFSFGISISLFFGFLVSIPVLMYEILAFTSPLIPSRAKEHVMVPLVFSCFLVTLGILFAYLVCLPAALTFLSKFGGLEVKSLISTTEYLSFVIRYLIGFGILFQLPLIMIFVNKIKKLAIKKLLRFEPWVIVLSFIVAAILTPTPDIINQLFMAVPIILLYQVSLFIIWLINRR